MDHQGQPLLRGIELPAFGSTARYLNHWETGSDLITFSNNISALMNLYDCNSFLEHKCDITSLPSSKSFLCCQLFHDACVPIPIKTQSKHYPHNWPAQRLKFHPCLSRYIVFSPPETHFSHRNVSFSHPLHLYRSVQLPWCTTWNFWRQARG